MFNKLLYREDVLDFIKQLRSSERYFNKTGRFMPNCEYTSAKQELALYIFYDALYKFQLLIVNEGLFVEYLEQLERLYRKLDNFDDIRLGVHKALCRMIIIQLGIKKIDDIESKKEVITYVYNKYLLSGYLIHGYSSYYSENIKRDGFYPEEYQNYYDKFKTLNDILVKYHLPVIIGKNFNDKKVSFTDDLVMGCFYSVHGPMYFSQLLMNSHIIGKKIQKDYYLIRDYDSLSSYLKRFLDSKNVSKKDQKFILDLVLDEWNLLNSKKLKISLMLVKRDIISIEIPSLEELIGVSLDDKDIYESVDRLLSSKQRCVYYDNNLLLKDIQFIDFNYDFNNTVKEKNNKEEISSELEYLDEFDRDLLNAYGKASLLLIFGALFISLGVIITIVIILQGGSI